jgi:hypothetical protein
LRLKKIDTSGSLISLEASMASQEKKSVVVCVGWGGEGIFKTNGRPVERGTG